MKLRAAIERERDAAAERKAQRDRNTAIAFAIDIFKIMPEVRAAASKIHYGSQAEIMAKIVQEKLAPKHRADCAIRRFALKYVHRWY